MLPPSRNIAFTGLAESGKSTSAAHCAEVAGYHRRSLARPIRALLEIQNPLLHSSQDGYMTLDVALSLNGGWQGIKRHADFGPQVRRLLQVTGTEWGRNTNPGIWIDVEEHALDVALPGWWKSGPDSPRVVWDDVRFDNEALWVRQHGGVVIEVVRPSQGVSRSERRRLELSGPSRHLSEAGISPTLVSYTVINTTVDELHGQLASILKEIDTNVRSA